MCHPVCGMMHIKEPLLLIGKRSPCGGSGFLLSLSEWSFTICLKPYNRQAAVSNKISNLITCFCSFHLSCPMPELDNIKKLYVVLSY